jgi:adenosylcobinamide-GDP ribazoletransferase
MSYSPFFLLRQLATSLMFLTRLPLPFGRTIDRPKLADSMGLFGVAGAIIGALFGLAFTGLIALGVPSLIAATLSVATGMLVTGALHEDGLADVADGFGGGQDRQARLLIMRDSRIGSYGTIALVMTLVLRVAALAEFTMLALWVTVLLCATAGAFSRAMVVDLMWSTRPARADGLSHMAGRPGRLPALAAILTGLGLAVAVAYVFRPEAALFGVAAATVAAAALRFTAIRLIDGQTGDVCGAVQVVSELAMLIVFASMVH